MNPTITFGKATRTPDGSNWPVYLDGEEVGLIYSTLNTPTVRRVQRERVRSYCAVVNGRFWQAKRKDYPSSSAALNATKAWVRQTLKGKKL